MKRLVLAVVAVGAWELLARSVDARTAIFLPAPSRVLLVVLELLRDGTLLAAVLRSTARVVSAGALATLLGVPLGAAIASLPRVGAILDAPLRLVRPVPPIAWVPLTMLWLGVTELQAVSVLAFAAVIVVASVTQRAIAGVPPSLGLAAAGLGASPAEVVLRVQVPAALPGVLQAVREGVGTAWFVLVAAEFLAASPGIGVLILEGRDLLDPARALVGVLTLGLCGWASDRLLAAGAARLTRWA